MYLNRIYLPEEYSGVASSLWSKVSMVLLSSLGTTLVLVLGHVVGVGALRLAVGGHGAPHALEAVKRIRYPLANIAG